MNKARSLASLLLLSLLAVAGCHTGRDSGAPPVSQAASPQAKADGLACARCVCSHFEPLTEAPGTCRMCTHSRAEHTRALGTAFKPGT